MSARVAFAYGLEKTAEAISDLLLDTTVPTPLLVSFLRHDERVAVVTAPRGAPLQDLLLWGEQLTDCEWYAQVAPAPTPGVGNVVEVMVMGNLVGHPVRVVSRCLRRLTSIDYGDMRLQDVDLDEVVRLAQDEKPYEEIA